MNDKGGRAMLERWIALRSKIIKPMGKAFPFTYTEVADGQSGLTELQMRTI